MELEELDAPLEELLELLLEDELDEELVELLLVEPEPRGTGGPVQG